jgi:DNA-binding response OmpR family regulator
VVLLILEGDLAKILPEVEAQLAGLLIAEDGSLSRTLLERSLQRAGYEVIAAVDGARALQELDQEDPPRLALLDWIMPGVDGAEICRELRTRKNKPYTYLILLSSRESKQDIVQGLDRAPTII